MLVSVAVITYNSSMFVIETLESVKRQDYKQIQLVISDDCSTDDTIDKCRAWLAKNKDRFVNPIITINDINKGVPGNLNNAIKHCNGEWIKSIAGDDILMDDCISKNIKYSLDNPKAQVIFSNLRRFTVNNGIMEFVQVETHKCMVDFFKSSIDDKLRILYSGNILPAPAKIIKRELLLKYPYNEKYKLFEDYPMWINLLRNKIDFYYLDDDTVYYRIGETLSNSKQYYFNERVDYYMRLHFYDELCEELYCNYPDIYMKRLLLFFKRDVYRFFFSNKVNIFNKVMFKLLVNKLKDYN